MLPYIADMDPMGYIIDLYILGIIIIHEPGIPFLINPAQHQWNGFVGKI